jgi:hypothetical protein
MLHIVDWLVCSAGCFICCPPSCSQPRFYIWSCVENCKRRSDTTDIKPLARCTSRAFLFSDTASFVALKDLSHSDVDTGIESSNVLIFIGTAYWCVPAQLQHCLLLLWKWEISENKQIAIFNNKKINLKYSLEKNFMSGCSRSDRPKGGNILFTLVYFTLFIHPFCQAIGIGYVRRVHLQLHTYLIAMCKVLKVFSYTNYSEDLVRVLESHREGGDTMLYCLEVNKHFASSWYHRSSVPAGRLKSLLSSIWPLPFYIFAM